MEHSTVHTLLDELASAPAPASTVDIGRAVTTGRLRIRRRRALASGSVALAVLATLFLVVGTAQPTRAPSGESPSPSTSTFPPEFFDPLRLFATLGTLPFTPDTVDTTAGRNSLMVVASRSTVPSGNVRLTVVTANHEIANPFKAPIAVAPGDAAHGQPAEPLDGHPAEWTWSGADTAALRWEYAPTAWAEVAVTGLPGDPRVAARQIAAAVRFGVDRPIRLPFKVGGVHEPLGPRMVMTSYSTVDKWRAAVYFAKPDVATGEVLPLSITATRPSTVDEQTSTTTVDGYRARSTVGDNGRSGLEVFSVKGVDVRIVANDQATAAAVPGGFPALFRTLDIQPDPLAWH